MKKNTLIIAFTAIALSASAQTTIPNGGFENWGNVAPGIAAEPTGWYSNKSGSANAKIGLQTAFKETTDPHSGSSSLRLETLNTPVVNVKVNGSLTTGVINAPTFSKADGYIGTANFSDATDIRRLAFVGRPDSLVGWYKYTKATNGSDAATESGKIEMFLHTNQYNAPETANGGNTLPNKIGSALYITPSQDQGTWKRFSVPFVYVNGDTPDFAMINMTSSANQTTNAAGSKLWLDDLEVIYNPAAPGQCDAPSNLMVSQNATSVDLSWTAAPTIPVGGYGYSIINADSSQSMIPLLTTTNTFVNGIATTQAQFAENLSVGSTYIVYLVSMCGPSPNDPAITLISDTISKTFEFGSTAGLDNSTVNQFKVYAFEHQMLVDLSDVADNNAVLTLIDITGKEVLNVKLNGNEKNSIAIPSSIQTGTYFYNVVGSTIQKTGKIAL